MPDSISIWRCTECGKWSHAVKRPKRHQRGVDGWTLESHPEFEDRIAEDRSTFGPDGEDYYMIWCGPFEEWTAYRTEGTHDTRP